MKQACAQIHLPLQVQMQMRHLHLHLHLIEVWWMHLHLHLHLIHPHFHVYLHLIQMHLIGIKCETNAKQMRNKCETNANQMRLCYCYIMFIFFVSFRLELVSGRSVQKPVIAVSESLIVHKYRIKHMCEWLSGLDCQGR